jgi:hypothetical protein
MPTLLLVLSLTVEMAQLQMQRLRLGYAVGLAAVGGASSVDKSYYARTGRLRVDGELAPAITRNYLERNLVESLGAEQAGAVADEAEIAIVNDAGGTDPFTGMRLDRPSVCVRIGVPYRLSLLGFVGALATGRMSLASNAQIRQ